MVFLGEPGLFHGGLQEISLAPASRNDHEDAVVDHGRVNVPVAEGGQDDVVAGENVKEFPLVFEPRGEEGGRARSDPLERSLWRNVGEKEFSRRVGRLQLVFEPAQLLPAEAEIPIPVDVAHEHEAHVVLVEEEILIAKEGPRNPLAFLPDVMVPVDMEDGAGRIADGLEVRAVVIDDGRDDPVSQMDDERRTRIESGDLLEKGPEGLVVVGDRVPDDDEPQISSIVLGRDRSRGIAVCRDDAPELVGDGPQLSVFAEPGQVISPVS